MKIGFIQAKGGQGTTVVAAMTALALSETGPTLFVGNDDVFAVLGAYPNADGGAEVTADLAATTKDSEYTRLARTFEHIVYDGIAGDVTYLVTRPCYLALMQATRITTPYDGIVLITEPGRALSDQDVSRALNSTVVTQIDIDPAIARAVDAGLLACRLPATGRRAVRALIRERV